MFTYMHNRKLSHLEGEHTLTGRWRELSIVLNTAIIIQSRLTSFIGVH